MRLFSLYVLIALTGCHDQPRPATAYSVPADLEPYVQAFRTEAAAHNQPLPVTNLIMAFGATSGVDVRG